MSYDFKFNFSSELENGPETIECSIADEKEKSDVNSPLLAGLGQEEAESVKHNVKVHECRPITPIIVHDISSKSLLSLKFEPHDYGPSEIRYLSKESVDQLLESRTEKTEGLTELIKHSDLKSGVYEGGFKVWECSIDLIEYMKSNRLGFQGKDVLELGCGGGLPAIYSLLCGANFVCFQDFNQEVIDFFTIPNLVSNLPITFSKNQNNESLEFINRKTLMLSGDWKMVGAFLKERRKKFDMILSSETIYNTANYGKMHEILCSCLKEDGYALLANKTYYFGVGGSSKDFVDYLRKENKLIPEVAQEINEGVNRDVLRVTLK